MKTAYVFIGKPKLFHFSTNDKSLVFTTSFQDLTFLNGVVVDAVRMFVFQEVKEQWVGQPTIAFLYLSDSTPNLKKYEEILKYVNELACLLHRYTQMGLVFEHKDTYSYPQTPCKWKLEEMGVKFKEKGILEGIYWADPNIPNHEKNGEILSNIEMKTVNADIHAAAGSDNFLTQSHIVHITVPGTNINIDASIIGQEKSVLEKMGEHGLGEQNSTIIYLLKLYNRAIVTEDIFTGYLILYQMIEVIIATVDKTKLDVDIVEHVKEILSENEKSAPYAARVKGALASIKMETSLELLLKGLINITSEEFVATLGDLPLNDWRNVRGKLVHPKKMAEMTDEKFVKPYDSLRSFWDRVIAYTYGELALVDKQSLSD